MEGLWQSLLELAETFIIPDWSALVAIIPLGLAGIVGLWLAWTAYRYATIGPARRGKRRITPLPPPGLHMPGGSVAPILGATGTALLLGGLVAGGILLWLGLTLLVLALLYWGRVAIRDYEHLDPVSRLPALVHAGPPPGVHIPAPSFRPLLGAIATFALLGGLVASGDPQPAEDVRLPLVVIVSAVILAWALLGWLRDARQEYVETAKADRTGHLEPLRAPGWPKRTLIAWVVLLAVAALYQFGIVPPRSGDVAGGTAPSPGASGAPSAGAAGPEVIAKEIQFLTKELRVPAGATFSIHFVNDDPATVSHDLDIRTPDGKTILQDQPTIAGLTEATYDYGALEGGTYVFMCSIHPIPAMTGTLVVE